MKPFTIVRSLALVGAMLSTLICAAPNPADAQDYPTRPVHLIVGYGAGGGADILARFYADKLSKQLDQTIVVENKPGANGNIAAEAVTRAAPDGHTILFSPSATMSGGRYLYKNMPYDSQKDFVIAAPLLDVAFLLAVGSKSPANSVKELTALLKAKNKSRYGTSNTTSIAAAQLYMTLAGIESQQIPYRNTPDALPELSDGTLDFMFLDGAFGLSQAKAGKVKLLGTTSARLESAPDVPTMAEAGLEGYGFTVWFMIMAPAGTPKTVIDRLNVAFTEIAKDPETKQFLSRTASTPLIGTPEETARKLAEDIETWGKIAEAGNMQPQ